MTAQWAWRIIALTIPFLIALGGNASAQIGYGPMGMPPASAAYGPAMMGAGYAPMAAPAAWGYAAPASYNGAGPAYGPGPAYGGGCESCSDGSSGGIMMSDSCDSCGDDYGLSGPYAGNHLGKGLAAILHLLAPYSEGGCSAPHWFDIHAEAVFLEKDATSDFVPFSSLGFAFPGTTPDYVLTSDSFTFDTQPGMRITGTYQTGPGSDLEVTYLGMFQWGASEVAEADGNTNLWSPFSEFGSNPLGGPIFNGYDDVDNADVHRISLASRVNSLEASYRRRWIGPTCLIQGSWLVGYRYFNLREDFTFDSEAPDNPDAEGNPGFMNYEVSAANHLHGVQFGGDMWLCLIPGLNAGIEAKAGVYMNSAYQKTRIVANSIQPGVNEEADSTDTAFLGELDLMVNYQINRNFTIRGGYMVLWVDEVALGTENFNPAPPFQPVAGSNPIPRSVTVQNNGDALWYGWTLGAEYMW